MQAGRASYVRKRREEREENIILAQSTAAAAGSDSKRSEASVGRGGHFPISGFGLSSFVRLRPSEGGRIREMVAACVPACTGDFETCLLRARPACAASFLYVQYIPAPIEKGEKWSQSDLPKVVFLSYREGDLAAWRGPSFWGRGGKGRRLIWDDGMGEKSDGL